jgi:hypothetical protein
MKYVPVFILMLSLIGCEVSAHVSGEPTPNNLDPNNGINRLDLIHYINTPVSWSSMAVFRDRETSQEVICGMHDSCYLTGRLIDWKGNPIK